MAQIVTGPDILWNRNCVWDIFGRQCPEQPVRNSEDQSLASEPAYLADAGRLQVLQERGLSGKDE